MKKFSINLFIVIFFSFIAFIFVEFSFRIYLKSKIKYSKFINEDLKNKTEYLFGPKRNLNKTFEFNNKKILIKTNSLGIRESKDYKNLDESIILLGDSVVFGEVSQNETIDFFLEKKLNIPVLNFGVMGFNTWQEYEFFKDKYDKSFNTKILILAICVNDFNTNHYRRAYGPKGKLIIYDYSNSFFQDDQLQKTYLKQIKFYLKKSEIINYFYHVYKNYFYGKYWWVQPKDKRLDNEYIYHKGKYTQSDIDLTLDYIEKIKAYSEKNNIKFIATILPHKSQYDLSFEKYKKVSIEYKIEEILRSKGISFIPSYKTFLMLKKHKSKNIWIDDLHPNKKGNKIIADIIRFEIGKSIN